MTYKRARLADIIGGHGIAGVHPAADLFPMLADDAFQAMCADVESQGFLHPVRIDDDDLLIDGRNRLQVGFAIGLDPTIQRHQPSDTLAYVIGENLHRRQLTAGQRGVIAGKIATMPLGANQHQVGLTAVRPTQAEAAEQLGTSPKAISQVRAIKEYAPELLPELEGGTLALEPAYSVAKKAKARARSNDPAPKPTPVTVTLPAIVERAATTVDYPKPKSKATFNKTNDAVDWASWTWNPVTGCLHGCTYCYAREMAYQNRYAATYPVKFEPVFHVERLDAPSNSRPGTDRPQDGRVFVCSMSDLFGEWVPVEWIDKVFAAINRAPEWEYLFLTKFPQRFKRLDLPPRAWFGTTVDTQKRVRTAEKAMPQIPAAVRWISAEPLLEPLTFTDLSWCDLLVIGAQSETRQPDGFVPAFAPPLEWVADLVRQAREAEVPVYLKPNLMGTTDGTKAGMQLPQEMPRVRAR